MSKTNTSLFISCIAILFLIGCQHYVPVEPPSMSDFTDIEKEQLLSCRPKHEPINNLSPQDLIGEWEFTYTWIDSSSIYNPSISLNEKVKIRDDANKKCFYHFYPNNTYRFFSKSKYGEFQASGKYTYDDGILTFIKFKQGAFRPERKYKVITYSPSILELQLPSLEQENEDFIEECSKRRTVNFSKMHYNENSCIIHEYSYYEMNQKSIGIMFFSPRMLKKTTSELLSPPTLEEMGVGREYLNNLQNQETTTQQNNEQNQTIMPNIGTNAIPNITNGINVIPQQIQQNNHPQPIQVPPPQHRVVSPQSVPFRTPQTTQPRPAPNFKRLCPKHGEYDMRSGGCPACRGTINW